MPEGHRLASRRRLRLAELSGEAFAFCAEQVRGGFCAQVRELCARAGFAVHVAQEVDGPESALAAVGSGDVVTMVTSTVRRACPEGIVLRPFVEQWATVSIAIVWRVDAKSRVIPDFVAAACEASVDRRPRAGPA